MLRASIGASRFVGYHRGMRARSLAAVGLLFGTAVLVRDAGACSCAGPRTRLLAPTAADDVPLNARVRLWGPAAAASSARYALRVHGQTAEVAVTTRTMPYGDVSILELVPNAPLAPGAQYEVATIDDTAHPPVTVYGTFTTGADMDTTAPHVDEPGTVSVKHGTHFGTCGTPGPWIAIEGMRASDPGRAKAQLAIAFWVADANGKIDDTKPPTAIEKIEPTRAPGATSLTLGNASVCDPRSFPFPKRGGPFGLGLALVDEAGNKSATRRVRLDAGVLPLVNP